jgi:hypothetical protein
MRPCIEQSNGPVSLSPSQSCPDCIINMSGYDFRKGQVRTHLALGKDAPLGRAVQRSGAIVAIPILSGLQHHYVRI